MSAEPPTIAYLKALRHAQITGNREGLEDAQREAQSANDRAQGSKAKGARVHFTTHARQRMAQRNLKPKDVYAIWTSGERTVDRNHQGFSKRYHVRLVGDVPAHLRPLRRWTLVMAEPDDDHPLWALVTVLGG